MRSTVCMLPERRSGKAGRPDEPITLITNETHQQVIAAISCVRNEIGRLPHVAKIAFAPHGQLLTKMKGTGEL